MIALVLFTCRRDIMGAFVNKPLTNVVAVGGTLVILALNAVLILHTFGVPLPGL
jgi:manganese transport protein